MGEKIDVVFNIVKSGKSYDLEIPINITTRDLIIGLSEAYELEIDTSDINQCYLKSENPIALLRGNKQLKDYGLRNGSILNFTD